MAQKYLDLTGLGKVWAKIKGNFLDLSGTGTMTAPIKFTNYRYWAVPASNAGLSIMSAYGQASLDEGAIAGGTNYAVGLNIGGYGYHMGLGWNVSNKKLYVRGSGKDWEEVVVASRLSSYLPLSGGTMTGTIERQYNAASDSPVLKIGSNNKDIQIFKVYSNDATYSDTGSLFGYSLKYIGSGTGVANLLRFIADNQTGTKVTALSMNQSGQIGILSDPNTSYALYVNGDISVANETISGAINIPGANNASVTTQGINFTYDTSNTAHIGLSTGLFMYSSGAITLRPNGATASGEGSGCLSVSSSGITAEEVITAEGFKKSGGTSSQFLKADGSVDSNTYATTTSLGSYLPLSGGTMSNTNKVTNLNADLLDGKNYTAFNQKIIFGGASGARWFKIRINVSYGCMMSLTVKISGSYAHRIINIGGYNYTTNKGWYSPTAFCLGSTSTLSGRASKVIFGKDGDGEIWFAVWANSYNSVEISNAQFYWSSTPSDMSAAFTNTLIDPSTVTDDTFEELGTVITSIKTLSRPIMESDVIELTTSEIQTICT